MAKIVVTRKQRIEAAEKPTTPQAKRLLGWWRNVHCGQTYELLWLNGLLCMRRDRSSQPYEKTADEFERLLSFGCFTRIPDGPL